MKEVLLALILVPLSVSPVVAQSSSSSQSAASTARAKSKTEDKKDGETPAAGVAPPIDKQPPVRFVRFAERPVIDGLLDEAIWKTAALLKISYQIQPGDNIAPSKPAEVLLGYDSKFLYFGFRAPDDAGQVRATLAKRDQIWDDDNVGIFLDTFNDHRRAYALFFNPLGVQADGIIQEGSGEDYSIDLVMESKGVVTNEGYTVEIAIPFKSLRYEVGKDKLWGAHFFRRIKRFNNELDSWVPVSRDISGFINQTGNLTGIEDISTERTLELIPSIAISETGKRVRALPVAPPGVVGPLANDPGRILNQPVRFDPGITLKYLLTPSVTLDLAVNPDFAQVEADQTVVTANQRFPIFFDEKRPFFFDGIEIFQTPIRAVHTRAIVDPDFAAKLTGRRGKNTLGLLLASDDAPGNYTNEEINDENTFPLIERFVEKNAAIGVLRVKRDIGKESSLGLIATTYNFIEKHNHLGGIDGRLKLDKKTVLTFQAVGTNSRRFFFEPELNREVFRTGNGAGYSWNLDHTGRHFGYFVSGEGYSADYRADVGFTTRTNTNSNALFYRYQSEPKPKARMISWRLMNFHDIQYDWQGRIQGWGMGQRFFVQLQKQIFIGAGGNWGYERVFEEEFGAKRTATQEGAFYGSDPERSAYRKGFFTFAEMQPSKQFSAFTSFGYTKGALDYDFGAPPRYPRASLPSLIEPNAPLDPGPGDSLNFNATVILKPADAMRLSLSYNKSRLVRHDTGLTAFSENIFSWHGTYNFTRFVFVRARVDYATLYSQARGQFLFGWTPSPGESFYVGYNDDLTYNGLSPFGGHLEPGFRRNGRTFFVKLSYLFRISH